MNTQKGNRGISLSSYSQTIGEMQNTFHTRDVERKMREDHFIRPMWVSPEETKKENKTLTLAHMTRANSSYSL